MAAKSNLNYYICLFYEQTHAWCLVEVMEIGSLVVALTGELKGGFRGKGY